MNRAIITLAAAAAALMLSGGAYAQNNTLATPTTKSPADAGSGYGTSGITNSESGAGSQDSGQPNGTNTGARLPSFGANNTLATPTTKSPAAGD